MTRVAVVSDKSRDSHAFTADIDALIASLSVDEKVELLAGQGTFKTTGLPDRGIPRLVVRIHLLELQLSSILTFPRHPMDPTAFEGTGPLSG